MVLKKTLESPLGCKEFQPVHHKGNQSWIFTGRTDAEAEVPVLWLHYVKNQLIGKDLGARKGWRKGEKGATEDDIVRWHHWLNRHESEQTLEDSEGQRSLVCWSPWGHKIRHNWATEQQQMIVLYLNSKVTFIQLSIVMVPCYIPTNCARGLHFLFTNTCYLFFSSFLRTDKLTG